jgi:hypothetical protein
MNSQRTTCFCGRLCERRKRFPRPSFLCPTGRIWEVSGGFATSRESRSLRDRSRRLGRLVGMVGTTSGLARTREKFIAMLGTGATRLGRFAAKRKDRRGNSAWEDPARRQAVGCSVRRRRVCFRWLLSCCRVPFHIVVIQRSPDRVVRRPARRPTSKTISARQTR